MKLFLISVLSIFLIFIGGCVAGFFMPNTLTVERSIVMDAYIDDVFPYLEDLEQHQNWAALDLYLGNTAIITGGADYGTGQTQAWQNGPEDYEFGSREIVQSQAGEFVQISLNIAGKSSLMTHALTSNQDETVTVLSNHAFPQPGFPYLGRLRQYLVKSGRERELDAALLRLRTIVEANRD